MGVMQSLRHDVSFLDCIPQIGASAFLFWPAAGASLSSRFRQTVKAKNAFTVCLPALVKANGHLLLFFSGQLQRLAPRVASAPCPSGRFRISRKAKDAFPGNSSSACGPARCGSCSRRDTMSRT